MNQAAIKPHLEPDPRFKKWLDRTLGEDGTYEDDEVALTEWCNGIQWNNRIRIKGGGPHITDDLVAEGCNKDRAAARREAEKIMLDRLRRLVLNANNLGFYMGQVLRTDIPTISD